MPRLSSALASLALALALSPTAQAADAHASGARFHPERAPRPELNLAEESHGDRAVQMLGRRLRDVAAWHGRSETEFATMLRRDHRLRIDRRGQLLAVETLEAPLPTLPADTKSLLDGSLLPVDQTFLLHSKRGSKRTIYLNFKGAKLTGTAWNGTSTPTITALPFDLDGIPYSFNTTELQRIQGIWQRVAEDYAPFDVDVTTEAPAPEALARSASTDAVFGTTVLITNSSGVYSCSCGGVAYIGVFDDLSERNKPALVFYNQLGAGNEKYVAEAISHEAGHNMGLLHDGTASVGYYGGQGTGATGWAPIMGVGYSKSLTQWSKGEYAGANNLQDDFKVMESNGLPIRTDDHGDLPGTATKLSGTSSSGITTYAESGIIERATDVDLFSFTAAAGNVTLTLATATRGANLDAVIELRDASNKVLASANPADALNASLTYAVSLPGTYYVAVRGTGKGDPLTTGYSSYASLGNYKLTVQALSALGTAPTAQLSASALIGTAPLTLNFSGAASTDSDGRITGYDWSFGDGGSASGMSAISHQFSTPGVYAVQLRVTDNSGMSSTKAVSITVNTPPTAMTAMSVADINLTSSGTLPWQAAATVKLVDVKGLPVAGAKVTVRWTGLVTGTVSATTNTSGIASFSSPATTAANGAIALSVIDVSVSGYQYDPLKNLETSAIVSR